MLLKVRYISDTFGEDIIIEVRFGILKKYGTIELTIYMNNCVVAASRWRVINNAWSTKVLK